MEQIKTLPIIDISEPMLGCTMHDTMDIIYEKYAKSINIKKFLPILPTNVEGIPIGIDHHLQLDIYDSYKFVKCKVYDLVIICIIMKKEKKLVTDLFKGLQKALADGNEKPLL